MGYDGASRPYSPASSLLSAAQREKPSVKPNRGRLQSSISQRSQDFYGLAWSGPDGKLSGQEPRTSYSPISPHGADSPTEYVTMASRSATLASLRSQHSNIHGHALKSFPERDIYEMQPKSANHRSQTPPSGYTAYNPNVYNRQNTHNGLYLPRSTTAPPQIYSGYPSIRSPGIDINQVLSQPPRAGTAPLDVRKTSTSAAWASSRGVLDSY